MLPAPTMSTRSCTYGVGSFPQRDIIIILGKRRGSNILGPPDKVDISLAVGEAHASVFLIKKVRWLEDGRL
jgi:hypothetical protein